MRPGPAPSSVAAPRRSSNVSCPVATNRVVITRTFPSPSPRSSSGRGADDRGVIAGQSPPLLSGQPACDLYPGPWRTPPVATRVVPDAFDMPPCPAAQA